MEPRSQVSAESFFLIKFLYRRTLCQLAHFDEIVNLQKPRPWYEKAVIKFAQITKIEKHLDGVKCGRKYHELLSRIPFDEAEEVATFQGDDRLEGIVPKTVYGKGTKYKYEDGEALIERIIKQLHEVGIKEIYVVVGFMKEKYEYLIDEYGVELVVNADYRPSLLRRKAVFRRR